MKSDIERAKEILLDGGYTCVFVKDDAILTENRRGVAPLLGFIDSGRDFSLFCAADKVVGRGAALLYAFMKIKALHAEVVSESALEILRLYGISCTYTRKVPNIINRKGDGICPMEKATAGITDPKEGYEILKARAGVRG